VTTLLTRNQQALSIDFPQVDSVFTGFKTGDFAVFYGHEFCKTLLFTLAVRAQLRREKGGLDSTVIYVDGGNTFNPYIISTVAQQYDLDPKFTLEKIFVSRAFTAYQLSALIFETLENALRQYGSKLVLISDITALFLDRDVPSREAVGIFNKIKVYLSELVKQKDIIIISSCFPHKGRYRRRFFLESVLLGGASLVIRLNESKGKLQFVFHSRPELQPCSIDLLPTTATLREFLKE